MKFFQVCGRYVHLVLQYLVHPSAAIYKCCLKLRFKLAEPITGDHVVKLPKTLFASRAVRCLLFLMLNSSFRGLDMRGNQNSGFLGLRWLDIVFQGQYLPILSTNYVAINKKILEKLPSQLYYIKMKTCYDQGWHRSCQNNKMMPLPILLAAVFLVTGNRSRELFPPIAASMFVKFKRNL